MAYQKRLTPAQRERATELLFQADEADAEIAEAETEHGRMLEAAEAVGVPCVLVSEVVHPCVTVWIGRRTTTYREGLKGPVRIEKRRISAVGEFVAIDQVTGSLTVLPSARVTEETPLEDHNPIHGVNETGHG